jgi:uncharacterized protein (TIGR02145 family)
MIKWIVLLTTTLLLLTCGGDDEIDVRASISEVTNITQSTANVKVQYVAENVTVTHVGVVYGATPGRLNIRTIVSDDGEPDVDYGVVSAPASVSGVFYADLTNLADGTEYFIAPFVKLSNATSEFPEGYFLPSGWTTFKTLFAPGNSPPTVSAASIVNISYSSAGLLATIESAGNPPFARRGFCYGMSPEPMENDGSSTCVPVYGDNLLFSETITNLAGNTDYNVRAYVSNRRHPVQYGKTAGFRTQGGDEKLIDARDGKEYKIVDIGWFTWMAENLNYELATGSWCYGDDNANCEKYGRLYAQTAAASACPAGWILPTHVEWNNLIETVGGAANAGRILKSTTWDGTNSYGWTALPGGYRDNAHVRIYVDAETAGRWWSGTNVQSMQTSNNSVSQTSGGGNFGYSVRCVKAWQ